MNDGWGISYEIALKWMPQDFTDDKSTLAQVMAWCHQVTSHYLRQCWPRSLSPYGVTRPQWVNSSTLNKITPILQDTFPKHAHEYFMFLIFIEISSKCVWLMACQRCFRYCRGDARQQAITRNNDDQEPWRHMASLDQVIRRVRFQMPV